MKDIWWYVVLIGTLAFAFLLVASLGNIAAINFSGSIIGSREVTIGSYTTTIYTLNLRTYLQNLEQTISQPIDMFKIEKLPDIKEAALAAQPSGSNVITYLTWIPKLIVNYIIYMANLLFWLINFVMNFVRFGLTAVRLIMTLLGLNNSNPFYEFITGIYNFYLEYAGYLS